LTALEAKSARERLVAIESELVALERARREKGEHGEFESEYPGYCSAQDTFYEYWKKSNSDRFIFDT